MNISSIVNFILIVIMIISLMMILILSFPNKLNDIFSKKIFSIFGSIEIKKLSLLFKLFNLFLCVSILIIPGHMEGHDNIFHIARISAISEGLKNGQFPVLIYPEYFEGYGYANGVFYPDALLYIPAVLNNLGVPIFKAYEILLFIIILAAYTTMYFSCYRMTRSDFVASVISLLYSTSSYFLVDLYARSALGEAQAFIYFPLIVYGFYSIACKDVNDGRYFTLGIVGIVLSHMLSIVICVILVLLMFISCYKRFLNDKKRFKSLVIYGLLSIGISLFFILPVFEMLRSDVFTFSTSRQGKTTRSAVNPFYTIIEFSYEGLTAKYIPQGIGIVFVYLLIMTKDYFKNTKNYDFSKKTLTIGWFFLFMSTSLFPWKIMYRVLDIIQFPWRFYICTTVCLLFAYTFTLVKKLNGDQNRKKLFAIIISCFSIFTVSITTYNLFATCYTRTNDFDYEVMNAEYLPVDVNKEEIEKRGEIVTSNNELEISFRRKGTKLSVDYASNNDDDTFLELPLIYYKGYKAIEDGESLAVGKGDNGLLRVYPTKESGKINVFYGFTNIRKIGLGLSTIFVIAFVIYCNKSQQN